MSGHQATAASGAAAWSIAASLGGAFCYAVAGVYLRRGRVAAGPQAVACGSQLLAALWLAPLVPATLPAAAPGPLVVASLLALALACTAVAYLLYFRLIADVGAATTLSVTFLIPAFAMLWGALFLGEHVTAPMLTGCGLVIIGVMLVSMTPTPASTVQAKRGA